MNVGLLLVQMRILLLMVLILPVFGQEVRAPLRLAPIDDTPRDRFLVGYVKQLKDAVAKRNVRRLRQLVDDDVVVQDKPERKGWKEFLAYWKPEDPQSRVWAALEEMLDVGFVREHPQIYTSPYFVWRFPDGLDPSQHGVVAWGAEALREKPDARSPAVKTMEFEVVRLLSSQDRWLEVETFDGQRGWVNRLAVKLPTVPRGQFNFIKGQWQLVMLVE